VGQDGTRTGGPPRPACCHPAARRERAQWPVRAIARGYSPQVIAPEPPITVVLVDDHARFRGGIRDRLTRAGVVVLGEAGDGPAGIALAVAKAPDVVLLDLNMPGMSGIQATRELLHADPRARIVMLTVSSEDASVAEAMLAGACGYVVKSAGLDELMGAVRAAKAGETFLSPPVASKLLSRWRALETTARVASGAPLLSKREIDVLRLVAAGYENTAIAESLSISPNTVKRHVAAILLKLSSDNRTQAAVVAVRERLI
jgi:DNA-binding NarL/FixJ family response regulator